MGFDVGYRVRLNQAIVLVTLESGEHWAYLGSALKYGEPHFIQDFALGEEGTVLEVSESGAFKVQFGHPGRCLWVHKSHLEEVSPPFPPMTVWDRLGGL